MGARRRPERARAGARGGGVAALLAPQGKWATAQDDGTAAEANATLRVVHASPGAPALDVLLDGQPLAKGLAYGTVDRTTWR